MPLSGVINKIFELSKLNARILLALTVTCGFFFFGPSTWFIQYGLEDFRNQYRPYLGVGFIVSAIFFLSYPAAHLSRLIYGWVLKKYTFYKRKKHYIGWLNHLTPDEKTILNEFIGKNTRCVSLVWNKSAVNRLRSLGVIFLPPGYLNDERNLHADFYIDSWAYEYLKEHLELLKEDLS